MDEILLGIVVIATVVMLVMMFKYSKFIHSFPKTKGQGGDGASPDEKNKTGQTDDVANDSGDSGGENRRGD